MLLKCEEIIFEDRIIHLQLHTIKKKAELEYANPFLGVN